MFASRTRELRLNQTSGEGRLWGELRARRLGGWKWRRQAPVGPYIVDFLCPSARLAVELDGPQHQDNVAYDERRTRFLNAQGLRVLRFPSEGVWEGSLWLICQTIRAACEAEAGRPNRKKPLPALPSQYPSPRRLVFGRGTRLTGVRGHP